MSNIQFFKKEKDSKTIQYIFVLSTLSIVNTIRQEQQQKKTTFSLTSKIVQGIKPEGQRIDLLKLHDELSIFFGNKNIQNLHAAIPYLITLSGNTATPPKQAQKKPRKGLTMETIKNRLKRLNRFRLFPELNLNF